MYSEWARMNRQKFFISSCSCVTDCVQPCVPWLSVFQQLVKMTVCLERTKARGKLLLFVFVFLSLLLLIIWYLVFCKLLYRPEYKTTPFFQQHSLEKDFSKIRNYFFRGANIFILETFSPVEVKHVILPFKYNTYSHTLLSGSWDSLAVRAPHHDICDSVNLCLFDRWFGPRPLLQ